MEKENNEEKSVMVVEALGSGSFENMCEEYVKAGYIMSSSNSCVLPESYNFQTKFIAVFVLPEVLGIDMDCYEYDEDSEGEEWKKGKKKE